jgi:hypothetical protein
MARISASMSMLRGSFTMPSMRTVQGRSGRRWAAG